MSGVFVNYRRDDTSAWAGRLHSDLCKVLTGAGVFMDIKGGIARGDDFGRLINEALNKCVALLVLIGPNWLELKRNGKRRIDLEDDWVAHEIATCLGREGVVLIPVLLGGVEPPLAADFPQSIREVAEKQAAFVGDDSWDVDVARIVGDLEYRIPNLDVRRTTFGQASGALKWLGQLADSSPAVASKIGVYREGLRGAARDFIEIETYKSLHDAFHSIEFECYRPLRSRRKVAGLWSVRAGLKAAASDIEQSFARHPGVVPKVLKEDIRAELKEAVTTAEQSNPDGVEDVVAALGSLLGQLPAELDSKLAGATHSLQSRHRLDDLAESVRAAALADAPTRERELSQLFDDLAALSPLRTQLEGRVDEHSRLQRIDGDLRMAVDSRSPGRAWVRIKRQQARLQPFSRTLREAWIYIDGSARAVDEALKHEEEVAEAIREHHSVVASTFRDVDKELKALSANMMEIADPLRALAEGTTA